jgi:hypothetical protein
MAMPEPSVGPTLDPLDAAPKDEGLGFLIICGIIFGATVVLFGALIYCCRRAVYVTSDAGRAEKRARLAKDKAADETEVDVPGDGDATDGSGEFSSPTAGTRGGDSAARDRHATLAMLAERLNGLDDGDDEQHHPGRRDDAVLGRHRTEDMRQRLDGDPKELLEKGVLYPNQPDMRPLRLTVANKSTFVPTPGVHRPTRHYVQPALPVMRWDPVDGFVYVSAAENARLEKLALGIEEERPEAAKTRKEAEAAAKAKAAEDSVRALPPLPPEVTAAAQRAALRRDRPLGGRDRTFFVSPKVLPEARWSNVHPSDFRNGAGIDL